MKNLLGHQIWHTVGAAVNVQRPKDRREGLNNLAPQMTTQLETAAVKMVGEELGTTMEEGTPGGGRP